MRWLILVALTWGAAAQQPVNYSHKTHVALGLKCKDCHAGPDAGERMTFPASSKCMACHRTVAPDKPAIRALAEYAKSKQPIPWKRIYAVAAGVYWSHRTHTEAGLPCETCHGAVSQMEVMTRVKDITSMTACMDCHRERNAGLGCDLCHESK